MLHERPYRIHRGDLFYIQSKTNTPIPCLTIRAFAKYHLPPGAAETQCKLAGDDSRLFRGAQWYPSLAAGRMGNESAQVINQLEHESNGRDPLANEMAD